MILLDHKYFHHSVVAKVIYNAIYTVNKDKSNKCTYTQRERTERVHSFIVVITEMLLSYNTLLAM